MRIQTLVTQNRSWRILRRKPPLAFEGFLSTFSASEGKVFKNWQTTLYHSKRISHSKKLINTFFISQGNSGLNKVF